MDNKKKDIGRLFKEHLPRPTAEELNTKAAASRRTLDQLRAELQEAQSELEARTGKVAKPEWPGTIEPLVLAAAFMLRGEADVDSITEKVLELSSMPRRVEAIRFIVHRLVRRGLLSESDRCFSITAEGERELAQARADAKRWIDALGDWPGPATAKI